MFASPFDRATFVEGTCHIHTIQSIDRIYFLASSLSSSRTAKDTLRD